MFTGIIEQTGRIVSMEPHGAVQRLTVECPGIAGQLREGDSLAVSGVCLTALDVNERYFHADLAAETIARTTLTQLVPGALVNLELPTAAGAPLGGACRAGPRGRYRNPGFAGAYTVAGE